MGTKRKRANLLLLVKYEANPRTTDANSEPRFTFRSGICYFQFKPNHRKQNTINSFISPKSIYKYFILDQGKIRLLISIRPFQSLRIKNQVQKTSIYKQNLCITECFKVALKDLQLQKSKIFYFRKG